MKKRGAILFKKKRNTIYSTPEFSTRTAQGNQMKASTTKKLRLLILSLFFCVDIWAWNLSQRLQWLSSRSWFCKEVEIVKIVSIILRNVMKKNIALLTCILQVEVGEHLWTLTTEIWGQIVHLQQINKKTFVKREKKRKMDDTFYSMQSSLKIKWFTHN